MSLRRRLLTATEETRLSTRNTVRVRLNVDLHVTDVLKDECQYLLFLLLVPFTVLFFFFLRTPSPPPKTSNQGSSLLGKRLFLIVTHVDLVAVGCVSLVGDGSGSLPVSNTVSYDDSTVDRQPRKGRFRSLPPLRSGPPGYRTFFGHIHTRTRPQVTLPPLLVRRFHLAPFPAQFRLETGRPDTRSPRETVRPPSPEADGRGSGRGGRGGGGDTDGRECGPYAT